MTNTILLRGTVVTFHDDPATAGADALTSYDDGIVVVNGDRIAWVGNHAELPATYSGTTVQDNRGKLILPGFVDVHLHFPQYRMLAAFGKDLLDWLNRYTFIEEQRYGDEEIAKQAATFFLDELARHGITSCLAFSTIHMAAADALFAEAQNRSMALITGKTCMDRNAPAGLCDTAQAAYDESTQLMRKWHGKDRLRYAISPRFAVTSSEAQLEACGALALENPDCLIQTHLSENLTEIETVANDFPWSKDYTDVYDRYGLLNERSFFAHGIHLSQREVGRLSEAGSIIAHCPTSNNFLGSGLFKLNATRNSGVKIGVGCDIGGGTSYSMFDTLRDAYTVSQLVGSRIDAYDAFHLATRGNANLLGLGDECGTLTAGKFADIIVLDPAATPLMAERHALSKSLQDVLFALMIMGDDRAVSQTYVAGKPMKHKV